MVCNIWIQSLTKSSTLAYNECDRFGLQRLPRYPWLEHQLGSRILEEKFYCCVGVVWPLSSQSGLAQFNISLVIVPERMILFISLCSEKHQFMKVIIWPIIFRDLAVLLTTSSEIPLMLIFMDAFRLNVKGSTFILLYGARVQWFRHSFLL